jgi:hypothetical protein
MLNTQNSISIKIYLATLSQQQQQDFFNALQLAIDSTVRFYGALAQEDLDVDAYIVDAQGHAVY